jgi:prepilin-type N-terminal cleavage/methylation domain-containing protein
MRFIKRIFRRTVRAFSLLEMALVLSIIGIISAYAIPVLLQTRIAARWKETDAKLEALTYALAGYAQLHKRLPCAANPAADSINAGIEREGSMVGVIPYRTLGIQESDAKDGFHHWISYSAAPDLTNKQSSQNPNMRRIAPTPFLQDEGNRFCTITPTLAQLSMKNEQGIPMLEVGQQVDMIAFVLVSHGPSGGGSFDEKGQRRPTVDATKHANTNGITFIERPISKECDDRIRWVSRNNLMAIYAKQPCKTTTR